MVPSPKAALFSLFTEKQAQASHHPSLCKCLVAIYFLLRDYYKNKVCVWFFKSGFFTQHNSRKIYVFILFLVTAAHFFIVWMYHHLSKPSSLMPKNICVISRLGLWMEASRLPQRWGASCQDGCQVCECCWLSGAGQSPNPLGKCMVKVKRH